MTVLVSTTAMPRALPPSEDQLKLPKLPITPFEGGLTERTPIWDSYDSVIPQNSSVTEIDKFTYLRSLLKGVSQKAIFGFMLTSAISNEAIAILNKCYDNKKAIVSCHMDALMALKAVTSNNNMKALHHLQDKIQSNVRGLLVLWGLWQITMVLSFLLSL